MGTPIMILHLPLKSKEIEVGATAFSENIIEIYSLLFYHLMYSLKYAEVCYLFSN